MRHTEAQVIPAAVNLVQEINNLSLPPKTAAREILPAGPSWETQRRFEEVVVPAAALTGNNVGGSVS